MPFSTRRQYVTNACARSLADIENIFIWPGANWAACPSPMPVNDVPKLVSPDARECRYSSSLVALSLSLRVRAFFAKTGRARERKIRLIISPCGRKREKKVYTRRLKRARELLNFHRLSNYIMIRAHRAPGELWREYVRVCVGASERFYGVPTCKWFREML